MSRRSRLGWLVAVMFAGIGIAILLPSAPRVTPATDWTSSGPQVRGAYHIHSNRSDGAGTLDEIASAASKAGLQFVIVTDHGDGTRAPEGPSYRDGVLCVDGVELNTTEGHYVALGLHASPFPLAGRAEAVIEDVSRFGGFGIVAHADSSRASLQWRAWDVPFDGLEWLNADSEWRDEHWGALLRSTLTYWARPSATLASLLDRPRELVARWDQLTRGRRVPALAGADAHARLGVTQRTDPDTSGWYLPVPSYESSFRVFSNHVVLDRPFVGVPLEDATTLVSAIRRGGVFTVIDGIAGPGSLDFTGTSGDQTARMGEDLRLSGRATLRARVAVPSASSMALLRDGTVLKETRESTLTADVTSPGAYRIEVAIEGAAGESMPWLFSNPIYVGFDRSVASTNPPAPLSTLTPLALGEGRGEASPDSVSDVQASSGVAWRYALGSGDPSGQYSAVRVPVSGLSDQSRLRFNAVSDRPMRLWVQLRNPAGIGERWGRTVYVDPTSRTIELPLDTFAAIGSTASARAPLAQVDSLLFVVDTLNTRPGSTGAVRLSSVGFLR